MSNVSQFFKDTLYACANEKYQSELTYSISTLPAEIVVNSGRVAKVASGIALIFRVVLTH